MERRLTTPHGGCERPHADREPMRAADPKRKLAWPASQANSWDMKRLTPCLLWLALIVGDAQAAPDPWHGEPLTSAEVKACRPVADALVFPVPSGRRQSANELLADRQIVPLGAAQLANLLDQEDVGGWDPIGKPYLVRAIAGFEGTGHFFLSVCAA